MQIGFIGLGMMGGPMCRNLMKHGHTAVVRDLSPEREAALAGAGATPAASIGAVVAEAEVVFLSLPKPADVERVVLGDDDGVLHAVRAGQIVVDLSTNSPTVVQRLAEALATKGATLLDAPVSGGVDGAEAATLAVMCGGDAEAYARAEPLLTCIGGNVFHTGPIGTGNVVKLCNNMTAFCNLAVAYEGLMLAQQAGVDPGLMADVMATASGGSFSLKRADRKGLHGDWQQEFALSLAHKDLSLALELARETDTPLTYGPLTQSVLQRALAQGWGGEDLGVILRTIEQGANTTVRRKG